MKSTLESKIVFAVQWAAISVMMVVMYLQIFQKWGWLPFELPKGLVTPSSVAVVIGISTATIFVLRVIVDIRAGKWDQRLHVPMMIGALILLLVVAIYGLAIGASSEPNLYILSALGGGFVVAVVMMLLAPQSNT